MSLSIFIRIIYTHLQQLRRQEKRCFEINVSSYYKTCACAKVKISFKISYEITCTNISIGNYQVTKKKYK